MWLRSLSFIIYKIFISQDASRAIQETAVSEREIYLLSPRALSPKTIAVALAKTSALPKF
ncbi:MAG: hypothetical protein B6D38_03305 [Anaerolineae bacterium UTCFX1]|jgi:uncharacterized sodium:solute symporter family permease YidK|nr:MAG: hypothetical protein B6D38_03305 [Anaerolineae bacterium UTCFX1]